MPEIVVAQDETEQIIESDSEADRFVANISGADIRVAHREALADRGTLIRAGDRVRLSDLRGQALYAYNDGSSDARIEIDRAAVDVAYFPRATVTTIDSLDRVEALGEIENTVTVDGSVSTDISDDTTREIGKARLKDSGGTLIDPATDGTLSSTLSREIATWSAGTLLVQEDTPLDVSAATVTTAETNKSPISDSTTANGSSNAAQLDLQTRTAVDVFYDVSGSATITVEVSTDGSTWRQRQQIDVGSAETDTILLDTGYRHVRAYADSNTNTIEIASKGL